MSATCATCAKPITDTDFGWRLMPIGAATGSGVVLDFCSLGCLEADLAKPAKAPA